MKTGEFKAWNGKTVKFWHSKDQGIHQLEDGSVIWFSFNSDSSCEVKDLESGLKMIGWRSNEN